jgi:hypothetical protein
MSDVIEELEKADAAIVALLPKYPDLLGKHNQLSNKITALTQAALSDALRGDQVQCDLIAAQTQALDGMVGDVAQVQAAIDAASIVVQIAAGILSNV